jgi:hypothetical protein
VDPGDPYLNVVLQWIDQTLDAGLNQNYTITISPDPLSTADSVTILNTTNTSMELTLFNDQDYNISMVARSCIGTSAPAEIYIRIIQFVNNYCTLILKDDVITMNYCPSSVTTTTTVTVTDEVMVSKFSNDSTLDVVTQEHGSST